MRVISTFVSGADTMAFLVVGLLLLRAWRRTRDSLFAAFAATFTLLAINQLVSTIGQLPNEEQSWVYLLRLAAFTILIFAIVSKNFGVGTRRS